MQSLQDQLLRSLSDGAFHSGQVLASAMGVSRAAIWKHLERLRERGLEIESRRGKGYRLSTPLTPLRLEDIQQALAELRPGVFPHIHLFDSIVSTNGFLLERSRTLAAAHEVSIAEYQVGGKGRSGRTWQSPYGQNIYLSFSWKFQCPPSRLMGLSLLAGMGVYRAVQQIAGSTKELSGLGVKWPNDLLHDGRKLAGVLIEMHGEQDGPCWVVTGIGLNVNMSRSLLARIDQPATSLRDITGTLWDRNRLCAVLLATLAGLYREFEHREWRDYAADWALLDVLRGESVVVRHGKQKTFGVARGVSDTGELLVEQGGNVRRVSSGEVSVRQLAPLLG